MSGVDFNFWIPKSGYINALDFESPKALGEYLLKIGNDSVAYNKYFEWKDYLRIDKNHPDQAYLCEMCIKLNLEERSGYLERKKLENMNKLYGLKQNCKGMSKSFSFVLGEYVQMNNIMSRETPEYN